MASSTVLVIDNHEDLLSVTKAMLARQSYHVLTAASASAGIDLLTRNQETDLVLADISLPGISKADLIRSVRQSCPSASLLLMAAYTDEPLDASVPFIQKPFTFDQLVQRVEEVLGRNREARASLSEHMSRARHAHERAANLKRQTAAVWSDLRATQRRTRQLRSDWLQQRTAHQKSTVLVAEGNAELRYAICRFLSVNGFSVLQAATHTEALQLWRDYRDQIDVLVTDLHGADGLELAAIVEGERPDEPVVFITAVQAPLPHSTVRKPIELEELLAAIRRALRRE